MVKVDGARVKAFLDAAALYRPFVQVVVAFLLVMALLPGAPNASDESAVGPGVNLSGTSDLGSGRRGSEERSAHEPGDELTADGGRSGDASPAAAGGALRVPAQPGPDCNLEIGRIKTPTIYAPPCVAPFKGNNGGATYQGVTRDAIKVVFYLAEVDQSFSTILAAAGADDSEEQRRQVVLDFADMYWWHSETYGRKVDIQFLKQSGTDEESTRADAIRVAEEIKPFAVIMDPLGVAGGDAFQDEIVARRILCMCGVGHPNDDAPYAGYEVFMDPRQMFIQNAEYVGKRLWGRNAVWAGDPTYHSQQRKLGLIFVDSETGELKEYVDGFEAELTKYGARLTDRVSYLYDLARAQESARTMIARLKDKGVTSVLCACDPFSPIFFTQEATRQVYRPEWIIIGWIQTDTVFFGRTYDQAQWSHAFGQAQIPAWGPPKSDGSYRFHVWHHGRPPAADDLYLDYNSPVGLFFTGIHMAGPSLTPETFRDGMFRYPPTGGGPTTARLSFGRHGYWPFDDYTAIDDMTEVWWDREARGQDEIDNDGVGMLRYVDGGRRYVPGQWPSGAPRVFDPKGTVTRYEQLPPEDQAPIYEHKHYK